MEKSKLIPYYNGSKWGFCDAQKNIVIPCKYDKVERFNGKLAKIFREKFDFTNERTICMLNCGLINDAGKEVLPCEYCIIGPFSENLAVICKTVNHVSQYGYMNTTGEIVIPLAFSQANDFKEGRAIVSRERYGSLFFIDREGKTCSKVYSKLQHFSEGLAAAFIDGRWGYINKNDEWVIPPRYKLVHPFEDGLTSVYVDNGFGYLGIDGTEYF
ncbi:MAG: WG repeat-containing protein [Tannerella sp.]|jgi:hypothetical protein|nr:WG repeat-containing protein [Tannerella sp.]